MLVSQASLRGMAISIPSYRRVKTDYDTFVCFEINLQTPNGDVLTKDRRFKDFESFHKRWSKKYPTCDNIKLPKKKMFLE